MITTVSLRTQFEYAKALQIHESFRLVAFEALGGKTSTPSSSIGDKPVGTMQELMSKFTAVGGKIG